MTFFLITFLSIYGGIHVYAFYRLHSAFSPGQTATVFLIIWLLFMTLAPMLVRLSESAGMDRWALFIAWPGYVWMGFIFIFVSSLFMADAARGACWLAKYLFSSSTPAFPASAITSKLALLTAFAASVYACYEARQIRSEKVTISSSKLSPDIPKIRIVQISDVHIGLLFREERLKRVLDVVRGAKPDIIVSTGDLVDGKLNREDVKSHQGSLAAMLASVNAPVGKYAVTGNHESYAGLPLALAFTRAAGFTLLRNQSVKLPNGIIISGVDDQAVFGMGSNLINAERELLA
ncbi:MAG: metallophosphoesterase, partial [Desulfuromonadaceae bacterium]|nr:metallophosphoesterase [Desulfuromonadaceae bacterium]